MQIEFWSWPSHAGHPVDMHVTHEEYKRLARYLNKYGLTFTIQIFDVQRLVDTENIQTSRSGVSWYSRYHPLNEVN
jgi:hypothetical protein